MEHICSLSNFHPASRNNLIKTNILLFSIKTFYCIFKLITSVIAQNKQNIFVLTELNLKHYTRIHI